MQSFLRYEQPAKYNGLFNQGATCYLNSLLQVLFMTEDFKLAVERYSSENPGSECIDLQLNDLFTDLKANTAQTYNITRKLSIDRVNEPRDAAEYFEKILQGASPVASKIFHGVLTHRTICLSCQTNTGSDLPFWHLPLTLVNSNNDVYSVVDGLKEQFRASDFTGDDQIYCDYCCAKSDFTADCVMKQHPDVLMLLLKRFELDYSFMKYTKNYSSIDISHSVQTPTTNQTYELYAVVEHLGDLTNGHYTATIKDGEDWYHFDDTRVTLINCEECQVDMGNAYLLFYKKQNDNEASSVASCPLPADNHVYGRCGDLSEKREKVEGMAGVGQEMEGVPSTEDTCVRVGLLAETDETAHAQMSAKADMDGQCAGLEQSEKEKEQTEPEDGVNGATWSSPSIYFQSRPKKSLTRSKRTRKPQKRTTAANLGFSSHQSDSEVQRALDESDKKMLAKGLYVKIIETEYRRLPQRHQFPEQQKISASEDSNME